MYRKLVLSICILSLVGWTGRGLNMLRDGIGSLSKFPLTDFSKYKAKFTITLKKFTYKIFLNSNAYLSFLKSLRSSPVVEATIGHLHTSSLSPGPWGLVRVDESVVRATVALW
jgi:hypothetical protein